MASSNRPTKFEVRCGACLLLLALLFLVVGMMGNTVDEQTWNVKDDTDLHDFHETTELKRAKGETSLGVALMWLAHPLLLISAYIISKVLSFVFDDMSWASQLYIWIQIMELVIVFIMLTSLKLVMVMYDWDLEHEQHIDAGYYVQLFSVRFMMEMGDTFAFPMSFLSILPFLLFFVVFFKSKRNSGGSQTKYIGLINLLLPPFLVKWINMFVLYCALWCVFVAMIMAIPAFSYEISPIQDLLAVALVSRVLWGIWLFYIGGRIDEIAAFLDDFYSEKSNIALNIGSTDALTGDINKSANLETFDQGNNNETMHTNHDDDDDL